jgi:hypothetical protein
MSTLHINGRKRPTLSEQIQRLDTILDGLADNLNEAVASAVKEAVGIAVQEAIRAVLTEVLANPELLAKLRPEPTPKSQPVAVASPVAPKKPGWLSRLAAMLVVGWGTARHTIKRATAKVIEAARWSWNTIRSGVADLGHRLRALSQRSWQACLSSPSALAWKLRKPLVFALALGSLALVAARRFKIQLLVALGVGTVTGVGAFFAGPWLGAGMVWLGGVLSTLAVQVGLGLRQRFMPSLAGD